MFVRERYVTNSSSSHSIVTNIKQNTYEDIWAGTEDGEFGWENFLLVSADAKRLYLAVTMLMMLKGYEDGEKIPLKELANTINEFFGQEIINPDADEYDYYVDHESIIGLPYDELKNLDIEACRDFVNYVVNTPDVAITGGNDNSDESFRPVEGDYEGTWGAYKRWSKS